VFRTRSPLLFAKRNFCTALKLHVGMFRALRKEIWSSEIFYVCEVSLLRFACCLGFFVVCLFVCFFLFHIACIQAFASPALRKPGKLSPCWCRGWRISTEPFSRRDGYTPALRRRRARTGREHRAAGEPCVPPRKNPHKTDNAAANLERRGPQFFLACLYSSFSAPIYTPIFPCLFALKFSLAYLRVTDGV